MANKVLFVFEGEKPEKHIVKSLQRYFVNDNTIVECVYGAEIYQIYRDIDGDQDLDTFQLVKERSSKNAEILSEYDRVDFAEIYLFFDYDGHSSLAEDYKLIEMINFFCEETDKGKLYVSYPMVESLRHIEDYERFRDLTVQCKENVSYKNIVHSYCLSELSDYKKYDEEVWKRLVSAHLNKLNYIVRDSYSIPNEIIGQSEILSSQIVKYINIHATVAVLSAFPIFLHDYYGNEGIKLRLYSASSDLQSE